MQKTCSNCSAAAQFSLIAIISSVGVSGRLQKSSPAVLFCNSCLEEVCERLCSHELCRSVSGALTALNQRLRERLSAGNSNELI